MSNGKTRNQLQLTRRATIAGAGILGIGALPAISSLYAAGNNAASSARQLPATPQENVRNVLRMAASLDPEDCPWFYNGSIYAVIGDEEPVELMRLQGMEIYRTKRLAANKYYLTGATVSFMTDLATGQWLKEFRNPFTGKVLTVPAAVQGGDPKRGFLYETSGIRPAWVAGDIPDASLQAWWTAAGEFVWLQSETVYPPGLPQPRKQRQTVMARKDHFFDPAIRRLSSSFTSTFFAPWADWLEMGDSPGHMVWHASGAKLDTVDDLPEPYATRIKSEYPNLLKVETTDDFLYKE